MKARKQCPECNGCGMARTDPSKHSPIDTGVIIDCYTGVPKQPPYTDCVACDRTGEVDVSVLPK